MIDFTCGDVMVELLKYPENTFDGCLCDPPYGLGFMGKEWDQPGKSFVERRPVRENTWDHVGGNHNPTCAADRARTNRKENVGYQDWCRLWSSEVYRVLKPGSMLMAFGGTRTHHRLACAIEDAGFELRDTMMWLYGSGFPKSLDVSRVIDKAAGVERQNLGPSVYASRASNSGVQFEGWTGDDTRRLTAPTTDAARLWSGYGTALKPAWEPIILAMKPCEGTFSENALKWGVAGLAIDGGRIGPRDRIEYGLKNSKRGQKNCYGSPSGSADFNSNLGRWPANLILDEEAGAMLDDQSGTLGKSTGGGMNRDGKGPVYSEQCGHAKVKTVGFGDTGGASRFFYCAKASRKERGEGNTHPTVKPLDLCTCLARLILPPPRDLPRCVLVPFSGSGSESMGCEAAGWDLVVGIEKDPDYVEIAKGRVGS